MEKSNNCNLCEGVFESILRNFSHLPIDRATTIALWEFEEMHDDSVCLEFMNCLPIIRSKHEKKLS